MNSSFDPIIVNLVVSPVLSSDISSLSLLKPPLIEGDLGLGVVQLLRLVAPAVGPVLVGLLRVVPEKIIP